MARIRVSEKKCRPSTCAAAKYGLKKPVSPNRPLFGGWIGRTGGHVAPKSAANSKRKGINGQNPGNSSGGKLGQELFSSWWNIHPGPNRMMGAILTFSTAVNQGWNVDFFPGNGCEIIQTAKKPRMEGLGGFNFENIQIQAVFGPPPFADRKTNPVRVVLRQI